MAKVTLPLLSQTASGRMGAIVYDKRGRVRRHVDAIQPNTSAQVAVRDNLSKYAHLIRKIEGPAILANLRTSLTYAWFAALVGKAIKQANEASNLWAMWGENDEATQMAAWDAAAEVLVAGTAGSDLVALCLAIKSVIPTAPSVFANTSGSWLSYLQA